MRARTALVVLVSAVALALVACGGGGKNGATATQPSGSATPAAGATTASGGPTSSAPTKQPQSSGLPANACALLTPSELHQLSPDIGEGRVLPASGRQAEVRCRWDYGPGTDDLIISVSQFPPGTSLDEIKASLRAEARDGGSEVSGLGDVAIFTSVLPIQAEVKAIVNGLFLNVELSAAGGRQKKDQVIALARAAASRM